MATRKTFDGEEDNGKTLPAVLLSCTPHSHVCPKCRHKWWHQRNEITDPYQAHICPECGEIQTDIFSWKKVTQR